MFDLRECRIRLLVSISSADWSPGSPSGRQPCGGGETASPGRGALAGPRVARAKLIGLQKSMANSKGLLHISRLKNGKGQLSACHTGQLIQSRGGTHGHNRKEDDILIKMVNLHCSKNWSTIARAIPGRSPNQCRERWMFYLDPTVNNQPWSEQEDMTLIHAHQVHGNKWCKLAKLFPGRTRKAIKNRWPGLVRRKLKSDLVREQFPCMPNDPLITKKKGSITIKSGQDTSTNNLISTDWPIRPKSEQGLTEDGRNSSSLKGKYSDSIHGKGPVAHLVDVSGKVDGQIARSSFPAVAKEKMNLSSSSVDQKVFYAAARFPRPLENEESTNSLEVAPNSVNTCISPAHDLVSSNDPSNETCRSADPESQELHLANIADLLDMSYCGSLMIVPPDSPNDGNSSHGM